MVKFALYSPAVEKEKLGNSDITPDLIDDETKGSIILEQHRKTYQEIKRTNPLIKVTHCCKNSVFQVFQSLLRTEVDLVEDDINLILNEFNSSFITYQLQPGIYTFTDFPEALSKNLQPEFDRCDNAIVVKLDEITLKTKLVASSGTIVLRSDEKLFFSTSLGFTPHWDFEHYIEYIIQKVINLSTTNEIHLRANGFDGSINSGLRRPILFQFCFR